MDEKLRKIVALMQRGVGGEQKNAEKIANKILKERGITLEDFLKSTTKEPHELKYSSKLEKKLACQIIGCLGIETIRVFRWKRKIGFDVTVSDWVHIDTAFSVLRRDLKNQLEIFFYAFLHKNDLLINSSDRDKKPTKEEIKRAFLAKRMSEGIERSVINKIISNQI